MSYPVAINIVGTASRKENSAATLRSNPKIRPPIIDAPDREVPGIMARDWKTPIKNAFG